MPISQDVQNLLKRLDELNAYLLAIFTKSLSNAQATEYLQHGLCRRLNILKRCSENILGIFPTGRKKILSPNELDDIQINLHAYLINLYGVLDNLAWIFIFEKGLDCGIDKRGVGLYKKETQAHLPLKFKKLLNSAKFKTWFDTYAKDFRHALAHRIPAYIPPFTITENRASIYRELDNSYLQYLGTHDFELMEKAEIARDNLREICGFFLHSISETKDRCIPIHFQIATDIENIISLLNEFMKVFHTENA